MNEDAVERAEIDPVEAPYDHVSDDDDEEPEVRKSRSGHLCWLRMRGLARSEPRHRQVPLSMPLSQWCYRCGWPVGRCRSAAISRSGAVWDREGRPQEEGQDWLPGFV